MPFSFGGDSSPSHRSSSHTTSMPKDANSSSGLDTSRRGGFSNVPTVREQDDTSMAPRSFVSDYEGFSSSYASSGNRRKGTPSAGGSRAFSVSDIPWGPILITVLVIGTLVFLWIYREMITEFLIQLLTWIIIIVVAIAILKWIVFGR